MRDAVGNHGYTCALLLETRKPPQTVFIGRMFSPLLSSCLVCVLPGEASLFLILFIDLECIKSSKALGKRVKGIETQVVFTEGERLEEKQMDTCR